MDLCNLNATDLQTMLARRDVSPTELMAATYDQIEAVNPAVNAIVNLLPRDQAMDLAQAAENAGPAGALYGMPIAIKDLANAKGFPTSMGSPLFSATDPMAKDDIMVARMRAAGAIIIGKTNTPEFGLGSHTTNPMFGPCRNPWTPANLRVVLLGVRRLHWPRGWSRWRMGLT